MKKTIRISIRCRTTGQKLVERGGKSGTGEADIS